MCELEGTVCGVPALRVLCVLSSLGRENPFSTCLLDPRANTRTAQKAPEKWLPDRSAPVATVQMIVTCCQKETDVLGGGAGGKGPVELQGSCLLVLLGCCLLVLTPVPGSQHPAAQAPSHLQTCLPKGSSHAL